MNPTQYKNIRAKIKTGWVYATNTKGLFSFLIKLIQKDNRTHVGLFLWEAGRLLCVEAMIGGEVRVVPASHICHKFNYIGVSQTNRSETQIKKYIWSHIGWTKYDLLGALFAPFKKIKNSTLYCSELVSDCLKIDFNKLDRGTYPSDIVKATIPQWEL